MFNSNKERTVMNNNNRDSAPSGINSLGNNTSVKGDLNAESDIRLDGELIGNLKCGGKLILGPKGRIQGEVYCENAVVEGKIDGVLKVKDHLHVKETARITGEISTQKLTVQSGALFNVKCEMGGQTIVPKTMSQIKTA